ncbi:MAG: DNA polymerase [Methylocella sp.]
MDYSGADIEQNEVSYPKHRTFLWGAKGWARDIERKLRPDEIAAGNGLKGKELQACWLGDSSKRALSSREILEWLLELPKIFGDVNFVMFSFGYDMTQILLGLPRETAWEILKQETFPNENGQKGRKVRTHTFYGPFGIKYIKGKSFTLGRLRDPERPFKVSAKGDRVPDYITSITIHDAFGFYSSRFADVVKSLVKPGYATQQDYEIIETNKARRHEFKTVDFDRVQNYCELELIYLSKALTVLRDGFDKMDIRLKDWMGAGSAAGALIKKRQLRKDHFSTETTWANNPKDGSSRLELSDIKKTDISPQQDAAHHAFIGGRIELLKQGYAPDQELFGYDIVSAYPSAMLELPSMRYGKWTRRKSLITNKKDPRRSIDVYREEICRGNVLNMYRVSWRFPPFKMERGYYDGCAPKLMRPFDGRRQTYPFFPLPYRKADGAILFPSEGKAWVMRDDAIAALKWIEAFGLQSQEYLFLVNEAWEFNPPTYAKGHEHEGLPFAFVNELFEMRKKIKAENERTQIYDITELAIKLCINSIYGKFAQKIGGSEFDPPNTVCPYYAAAITAACRRRVCEAALLDPEAIVMFATDGIVSTRPLNGLAPIGKSLGDWETKSVKGGIFLQSGYYSYIDDEGKKTKLRGSRKTHIVMPGTDISMHDFLIEKVLTAWGEPKRIEEFIDLNAFPSVDIEQNTYITAGSAVVSLGRWRVAGRWAKLKRRSHVHSIGVKRVLDFTAPELYWTTYDENGKVRLAERCYSLVRTIPRSNAIPKGQFQIPLSAPNKPEWLSDVDGEGEERRESAEGIEGLREMADLMEGI